MPPVQIHGPTDLALRLDYQVRHLLVDEFQDTSPTQMTLLARLTAGWEPGDGRTLFCVGDPMQSIYRFRKADVGLFLAAAADGIGDIPLERLALCRNNRSCPPVIDWINDVFRDVFPASDDVPGGAIRYRPFVATRALLADLEIGAKAGKCVGFRGRGVHWIGPRCHAVWLPKRAPGIQGFPERHCGKTLTGEAAGFAGLPGCSNYTTNTYELTVTPSAPSAAAAASSTAADGAGAATP